MEFVPRWGFFIKSAPVFYFRPAIARGHPPSATLIFFLWGGVVFAPLSDEPPGCKRSISGRVRSLRYIGPPGGRSFPPAFHWSAAAYSCNSPAEAYALFHGCPWSAGRSPIRNSGDASDGMRSNLCTRELRHRRV